jgi:hypothetical protein
MSFEFATCDRNRALGFLRQVYPSSTIEDSADSAGPMLDLVEADIIRIQDPMMHGPRIQVSAGKNWREDAEKRAEIAAVCAEFHRRATESES